MSTVEVFFAYAHEDELWRVHFDKHLSALRRQKRITTWHDYNITPGTERITEINKHLSASHLIVLLISSDFLASDQCWSLLKKAIKRYNAGEAHVIPIIVRPVDWEKTPFSKLQALPRNGNAISQWDNIDEPMAEVAKEIRKIIEIIQKQHSLYSTPETKRITRKSASTPLQEWNVPFPRNPIFTGREHVLERLHTLLTTRNAAFITQPPAISGLGGIGKTQTAVEYAYRYQQEYQYVFWLQANTQETLISDIVILADLLTLTEAEATDQRRTIEVVKDWFEQHAHWLLIVDNADDLPMVDAFLPRKGSGHILLTTRSHTMSGRAQRVDIETMEADEGVLFLLRRASLMPPDGVPASIADGVRAQARAIVQALGGLPLALDQAGAYIEETGCSLSRYLELYQARRKALHQRRSKHPTTDHPEPVATTWSLSFQKVEQANPAAAELLRYCAFLSPDTIPEELLTEGVRHLSPLLQSLASDPLKLDDAIGELLNYSLIRRNAQTTTLSIHRLVQAVLIDEMNQETQEQWAEHVVRVLNQLFLFGTAETWPLCRTYLPHALLCAISIVRWNMTSEEAANLLNNIASYLHDVAHFPEVEPLYQRALAIRERVLGEEHPETADSLNDLALLYYNQEKYEQAEPLSQRALAINERVLGEEHPNTKRVRENFTNLHQETKRK